MDVEAADSSSATENLAATQTAATGENNEAAAPVEGDTKGSLLEAVKAVIEDKKPEEAPAKADDAQPEEKADENPEAKAEEDKEADDKLLPFHNHPRFKEVISQKNAFKRERDEARQQLAEFEPMKADAGHYQSIVSYMGSNNLTMPEVNTGFEIMATMKNDPLRCLELLRPYYQHLQQFAGEILPEDLAGKVESGDVEEAIAREVASNRHKAEFERQRRERWEQEQSQQHQRHAQEQVAGKIMGALTQWEAQVKSSDPDYAKMEDFVIAELKAVHLSRPPRSADEAVANAKAAYDKVKGNLVKMRPAPTPATPVSSASSITGAREQPRSALDAVKQSLGRR